jgi:hypothetical protein
MVFTTMDGSLVGVDIFKKKKEEKKKRGPMGMVERGVFWLLVEGQQLPWLLWLVPLIVITQTIFCQFQYTTCVFDCGADTWKVAQS